ncbi:AraC family transcriptional regulator [Roseibium sp. Sym1]|uniref:AraC family transcriptional regulator n=1 Tax=Roseibium sp. Sym1 TaxID=3016006 RepID=UPI0022B3F68A|nr:AraC family transcriptional regulator [Roseibium sp. Sym1]
MDLTHLIALSNSYRSDISEHFESLPGLGIFCRNGISDIEAFVYEPAICLILQGSKVTSIGTQLVELAPGDALLISHDVPVVSRITRASAEEPYLAVVLILDLALLRSLYDQVVDALPPAANGPAVRSLTTRQADPVWLAPLVRYLELAGRPLDARVLGPSIRREIHYRLLLSPIGGMLRNLLIADSHASRIARAIGKVRKDFRAPLSVTDLARISAMSPSSFHEHFKSVTGTTPLQYQKDLRLIEAKALLVSRQHTVAEAAYAVGYESPTHFSRDYSRKFGQPPSLELS